jgi:hypothetical protein
MSQQGFGAASPFLDPMMAAFRERAVAGEVVIALRLGRIDQLLARRIRSVERNEICCHCFDFTGWRMASGPGLGFAKLAVSVAGINDRSRHLPTTNPIQGRGQLSTTFG